MAGLLASAVGVFAITTPITDYGAVNDGKTLNTAAIQAAINACAAGGGGVVVVPPGAWLTGSVQLKSHVTLELENGAVLRGSPRLDDYPPNGFKHQEMGETRSLLWAIGEHDVAICGDGSIELADRPFFAWDRLRTGLRPIEDAQLQDWQRQQCVVTALHRPTQPLFFHQCRQVRVEGVTITHSPCWTLVFSCCDGVTARALRIENNLQIPNNDGIHFSGSKNIVVSDCIISGGDDSLAFSAITDPASAVENVVITNCVLTSRSAGVRVGFNAAKVRNVAISNVVVNDSQRGILIQAGDAGFVENVAITNVVMRTRMYAGAWWGKGEPLVISAAGSGRIHAVTISHVRAQAENSIVIVGERHSVRDITLDDWTVGYSYSPNSPLYGTDFDLAPAPGRPSPLNQGHLPWLYAESVSGLRLRNMHFRWDGKTDPLSLEPILRDVTELNEAN